MEDEHLLGKSWHDSAWIPSLNPGNILDYFGRSTFYDKTCNNEVIKMQRLPPEKILQMTGMEYKLLHERAPILYIIRKQYRTSPEQVTPVADFYIIAGRIYMSPDLGTVVNSRLLNTTFNLNAALNKAISCVKYHPSSGYSWDFREETTKEDPEKKKEQASWFQRQRVDLLLGELIKQYPMKVTPPVSMAAATEVKTEDKSEPKAGEKRSGGTLDEPSSKMPRIKTEVP